MSNIEKIRQEIERRKKVYLTKNGFPKGTFGAIKIETYEGLLVFIDSLPEEFPPYCTGFKGDPDPAGVWKPSEEQDYSGLSDLERAIHRGFLCGGMENVPVAIIKETAKEVQLTLKAEG